MPFLSLNLGLTLNEKDEMKNCRRLTSYFHLIERDEQPNVQQTDEAYTVIEVCHDLEEKIARAISKHEQVALLHRNAALAKKTP